MIKKRWHWEEFISYDTSFFLSNTHRWLLKKQQKIYHKDSRPTNKAFGSKIPPKAGQAAKATSAAERLQVQQNLLLDINPIQQNG
jgi:hypothetical protein